MSVSIGSTASAGNASDIILSIRDQIPDMVADAADDGNAFTLATLLRWLNDAGRVLCQSATPIIDWYAIRSVSGMDVYELPQYILNVEQAWYDHLPLERAAEADNILESKMSGRSWWFGPHSIHATPRLYIYPAASRSGLSTALTSGITDTATTIVLNSVSGLLDYGLIQVESELVLYRNVNSSTNTLTNILRGQGGTKAEAHALGAAVTEGNIMFKCSRLPKPLVQATDPIEIPQGLWPLLELYVLSKVREAEQEYQASQSLRQEFQASVDKLAEKASLKGLKQGIQVRLGQVGPALFGGRVYIP